MENIYCIRANTANRYRCDSKTTNERRAFTTFSVTAWENIFFAPTALATFYAANPLLPSPPWSMGVRLVANHRYCFNTHAGLFIFLFFFFLRAPFLPTTRRYFVSTYAGVHNVLYDDDRKSFLPDVLLCVYIVLRARRKNKKHLGAYQINDALAGDLDFMSGWFQSELIKYVNGIRCSVISYDKSIVNACELFKEKNRIRVIKYSRRRSNWWKSTFFVDIIHE